MSYDGGASEVDLVGSHPDVTTHWDGLWSLDAHATLRDIEASRLDAPGVAERFIPHDGHWGDVCKAVMSSGVRGHSPRLIGVRVNCH
jgi:hypothetical protein